MKSNFRLLLRRSLGENTRTYSSDVGEIKIPQRIRRSPTDILKALSSTVGVDPTAAHYKFHDDPYLMPYSNPSKRSYALSQEAGRKAAQWVRQTHADLFQHKVADPLIEAYVPKVEYNDESNVSEQVLQNLIDTQQVSDVITVYQILKKREIGVSVATKQRILELVSFYNCQDPLSDQWVEENWFRQSNDAKNATQRLGKKTWKDDGFAEKVFEEVVQGGGDVHSAHCALICGMLKHGQVNRAWKLIEECKQNGIKLNTEVYNELLRKSVFLRESHEMVWQLMVELMVEMQSAGIRPNLGTLNSVLHCLEAIAGNKNTRMNAQSVLLEFKNLGIEASLASYAHLIRIFVRDAGKLSGVIRSILDTLEKNPELIKPKCPADNLFFLRAMDAIANTLGDRELASRLDKLLHKSDYSLIGNSFSESTYYRFYFLLLMRTSEIDEFMDFYYKFVPNIYVPELGVTQELMNSVEAQMGWKHIPKLWGDLVLFEQVRTNLVGKLLSLAMQGASEEPQLAPAMAEVCWSIWEKLQSGSVRNFEWSGEMMGDILSVILAGKELGKAHIIMDKIDRMQDSITGEPAVSSLEKYVDACLEATNIDGALRCIKYCDSRGMLEMEKLLAKITGSGLKLDGPQQRVVYELQKKF
uniref:Small ribosomal subunit protein mS39 n=1 Tax=Lygus hesperus TaxID=30085 RepID=A0A0A9XYH4_LYGHE